MSHGFYAVVAQPLRPHLYRPLLTEYDELKEDKLNVNKSNQCGINAN